MVTVTFKYVYDHAKNVFSIRNDGSNYTLSELSWKFLKDYDVYNFEYKDIKHIDIETGKEKIIASPSVFSFDVSTEG
jgi:hypothetical protein